MRVLVRLRVSEEDIEVPIQFVPVRTDVSVSAALPSEKNPETDPSTASTPPPPPPPPPETHGRMFTNFPDLRMYVFNELNRARRQRGKTGLPAGQQHDWDFECADDSKPTQPVWDFRRVASSASSITRRHLAAVSSGRSGSSQHKNPNRNPNDSSDAEPEIGSDRDDRNTDDEDRSEIRKGRRHQGFLDWLLPCRRQKHFLYEDEDGSEEHRDPDLDTDGDIEDREDRTGTDRVTKDLPEDDDYDSKRSGLSPQKNKPRAVDSGENKHRARPRSPLQGNKKGNKNKGFRGDPQEEDDDEEGDEEDDIGELTDSLTSYPRNKNHKKKDDGGRRKNRSEKTGTGTENRTGTGSDNKTGTGTKTTEDEDEEDNGYQRRKLPRFRKG
jgi:hypothetical protein